MDRRGWVPPSVRRVMELVEGATGDPSPSVCDCRGQPDESTTPPVQVRLELRTEYRAGAGQYRAQEVLMPEDDPASWRRSGVAEGEDPLCGCGCGSFSRYGFAGQEVFEFDDGGRT